MGLRDGTRNVVNYQASEPFEGLHVNLRGRFTVDSHDEADRVNCRGSRYDSRKAGRLMVHAWVIFLRPCAVKI